MKRVTVTIRGILGMLTTTAVLMAVGLPEFEISRSTMDGGGVMRSTGDEYELSGTIGQPDAGVMGGGGFTLSGGFWFGLLPTDCNEDGLISFFDLETFTSCLLGPSGGIGASPCQCFDVDGDGNVTLSDYARLQAGFTGQ